MRRCAQVLVRTPANGPCSLLLHPHALVFTRAPPRVPTPGRRLPLPIPHARLSLCSPLGRAGHPRGEAQADIDLGAAEPKDAWAQSPEPEYAGIVSRLPRRECSQRSHLPLSRVYPRSCDSYTQTILQRHQMEWHIGNGETHVLDLKLSH